MKIVLNQYCQFADKEKSVLLFETEKTAFESGHLNLINGVSGSGKTALLNSLCGRSKNYSGSIDIDGKNIKEIRKPFKSLISYVTVDNCCISELTVKEHLDLVDTDSGRQQNVLKKLKLSSLLNQKVSSVSKGEQIRVAIATCLLKDTPIFLFDEPTANLDDRNKELVFSVLENLALTHLVIVSTHDLSYLSDKNYSLWEVNSKHLLLQKTADISSISGISAKAHEGGTCKSLFHLGLIDCFKHKIQFCFSLFLSLVLLFCTFLSVSAGSVNKKDTLLSAISSLSYDYNEVSPESDQVDFENGSLFQAIYADYKYPSGFPLLVCQEDLDSSLREKCQALFDRFEMPEKYRLDSHYHPILLSSEIRNKSELFTGTKTKPEIGDVVSLSLAKNGYALSHAINGEDQFVLAGVFDYGTDKTNKNDLSSLFPGVIKRKDYIQCLRNSGIRSTTLDTSLLSLCKDYLAYCDSNGLTEPTLEKRKETTLGLNSILRLSDYYSRLIKAGEDEKDGQIYYQGRLPREENEIRIPDDDKYLSVIGSLFRNQDVSSRKDKSFFLEYGQNNNFSYPLASHFGTLSIKDVNSFSISGTFHLNSSRFTRKDCIIVSDAFYDKFIAKLKEGYKDNPEREGTYYGDKSYLASHVENILNGTRQVASDALEKSRNAYEGRKQASTFFFYLSLFIGIVSLVITSIYVINTKRERSHAYAVLDLLGKTRWQKLSLLLSALLPLSLLSLALGLSLSQWLTTISRQARAMANGFAGQIVLTSMGLSYLARIASFFVLLAFSIAVSYLGKKKPSVQQIKEQE